MVAEVNAGHGALGKIAKDPAFAQKLDDTVTRLDSILKGVDEGNDARQRQPRYKTNLSARQTEAVIEHWSQWFHFLSSISALTVRGDGLVAVAS